MENDKPKTEEKDFKRPSIVGPLNHRWKGGKIMLGSKNKYWGRRMPFHHKTEANGYVREHVLIVEEVLGKTLPKGAVVHHVNENGLDNRLSNLVACENETYHKLLHKRMRARKLGYPAWYLKCKFCKQYDDPKNLHLVRRGRQGHHSRCQQQYDKERRA